MKNLVNEMQEKNFSGHGLSFFNDQECDTGLYFLVVKSDKSPESLYAKDEENDSYYRYEVENLDSSEIELKAFHNGQEISTLIPSEENDLPDLDCTSQIAIF